MDSLCLSPSRSLLRVRRRSLNRKLSLREDNFSPAQTFLCLTPSSTPRCVGVPSTCILTFLPQQVTLILKIGKIGDRDSSLDFEKSKVLGSGAERRNTSTHCYLLAVLEAFIQRHLLSSLDGGARSIDTRNLATAKRIVLKPTLTAAALQVQQAVSLLSPRSLSSYGSMHLAKALCVSLCGIELL